MAMLRNVSMSSIVELPYSAPRARRLPLCSMAEPHTERPVPYKSMRWKNMACASGVGICQERITVKTRAGREANREHYILFEKAYGKRAAPTRDYRRCPRGL